MYIHNFFTLQNDEHLSTLEYKKMLSTLCSINTRRFNRFNTLAVYGAMKCLDKSIHSENIGVYMATECGPVESLRNVLQQINDKSGILMPFDFLGLNTSASFYVAQALQSKEKHMVLSAHQLSFEKAIQLAYYDLQHNELEEVLIGKVDIALDFIENYEKYITEENAKYQEQSCWIYANNNPKNAICKIDRIEEYSNREDVLAKYNTENVHFSFSEVLQQCLLGKMDVIYIAQDKKMRSIVIHISKV